MGIPVTHAIVLFPWSALLLLTGVDGHIGEPCNSLLKICLPPSPHIYCDDSNICRCKTDYPVEIQPHTCKSAKRIGERCSHVRECTYTDPNSFCTKTPYSSECSCTEGYKYSFSEERCVPGNSLKNMSRTDSKWLLPSTVTFLFICLGIVFCFSFFWYFFCRQPPDAWEEQIRQRENRQIVRLNARDRVTRESGDYLNSDIRLSAGPGHLPSYDSAVYNQPPPSYEEAIKIKNISFTSNASTATTGTAAATTTATTTTMISTTGVVDTTISMSSSQGPKHLDT